MKKYTLGGKGTGSGVARSKVFSFTEYTPFLKMKQKGIHKCCFAFVEMVYNCDFYPSTLSADLVG